MGASMQLNSLCCKASIVKFSFFVVGSPCLFLHQISLNNPGFNSNSTLVQFGNVICFNFGMSLFKNVKFEEFRESDVTHWQLKNILSGTR